MSRSRRAATERAEPEPDRDRPLRRTV